MGACPIDVEISEVEDVHPLFRANPFLVEEGATLVRGEKYLSRNALKRIDLLLHDSKGTPMFVEIKWTGVDLDQVSEYRSLIEKSLKDYRLMWMVPDDFSSTIPSLKRLGVEVKIFSRQKIIEMVKIRRLASAVLAEIKKRLQQSFEVVMHGERVKFDDSIHACYFEGRAKTDKGVKKLGMKQPAIGRYLDLVRCVATSPVASALPELAVEVIWELLIAPYCYKPTRFWVIVRDGFAGAKKIAHLHRSLIETITYVWEAVNRFHVENSGKIRGLYDNDVAKYDLIVRVIDEAIPSDATATTVGVKDLVDSLIEKFALLPLVPTPRIWHSTLNQWVENIVTTSGYENDFAKRIIEIAVLKRMLIPVRGITIMWVLAPRYREGKLTVDRVPCQSFTYNREHNLYLEMGKIG
jgi:hypothetical protein